MRFSRSHMYESIFAVSRGTYVSKKNYGSIIIITYDTTSLARVRSMNDRYHD